MIKQLSASARTTVATLAATLALLSTASQVPTRASTAVIPPDALAAYAKLPAAFVQNQGQLDDEVRYYAQGPRYAFYLTGERALLSFVDDSGQTGVTLGLGFPGSTPRTGPQGIERAAGDVNYFHGSDSSAWRTGIPRYSSVAYRDLWPGIDLRLGDEGGTLKYEFRLQPGAQPSSVRLEYSGARGLSLDSSGVLLIDTELGTLRDDAPTSYQMIDGQRVPVRSRFVLRKGSTGQQELGFVVEGYRSDRELVIDPGIQYSTFLGGSSHELGAGIQVDQAGNAFIVGTTQSPDFRTTAGAFRRTGAAGSFGDVFVTKLNAAGSGLIYSTFIGGNDFDFGRAIAIDAAGNAYITGQTKSPSFPTTGGAFDRTFNVDTCPRCGIDQYDAFVTKLNATGSALVYSSFLGGFDIDDGLAIAVDGAGNAYVTGETASLNFPTRAGSFDTTRNGSGDDAFVTKFNATGSALLYSTFLGGSLVEFGTRIAVSAGGDAFVVGTTSSADFPVTAGAFDTTANGQFDAFVTRLNASGSALVYSTFLGGSGFDSASGLFVDATGSAYVAGGAGSLDFPTTAGAFDTTSDGSDAFLSRLNPAGSALIFSTVLGGSSNDAASAVVLDAHGNAWLTGGTNSIDFPVTGDAADTTFNGVADAFIAGLGANGSSLIYSTYLGGTNSETGDDLAVGSTGDVFVTGHTYSADFPTTAGAFDVVFNGDLNIFWGDAFVTKLDVDAVGSTPPSTPPPPDAPALLSPFNNDVPLQPITFDWNETSGAVSYVIQIDDSSAFTAPLVREQAIGASVYATSGLARVPHFWRVRAFNLAGVAGPWSAIRTFTPGAQPAPPVLSSFETNPTTVVGGNPSSGTVVLSTPALEGGAAIGLSSSNPAVASVPATATAAANGFTATFAIQTSPVGTATTVTLTASYNGTTRTATLTVTPAASQPPAVTLTSVTLSPSSVTGGTSAQGTVLLSGAAPQTGSVVTLSSSNAAVASVPQTVTVNAGAQTASFTISTSAVSAAATATISASYLGATRTSGLTVNPPAQQPPATVALSVSATGRSGERVTSAPAGINVATGSSGSAAFTLGTSITLSVTNGRDAVFSGACSSGGAKRKTCTFTLSSAASVTVNVQ